MCGAARLHKDFSYLSNFIDVYLNDDTVKGAIAHAASIDKFYAIIRILSEQPSTTNRRSINGSLSSRNRVAPMEPLVSKGQTESSIPEKAQWEALRAGVPIGKMIFPCLPVNVTNGC